MKTTNRSCDRTWRLGGQSMWAIGPPLSENRQSCRKSDHISQGTDLSVPPPNPDDTARPNPAQGSGRFCVFLAKQTQLFLFKKVAKIENVTVYPICYIILPHNKLDIQQFFRLFEINFNPVAMEFVRADFMPQFAANPRIARYFRNVYLPPKCNRLDKRLHP